MTIPQTTPLWNWARKGALLAFLLVLAGFLLTSAHTWALTAAAPLGWRLRVLLPEAYVAVPCALGLAFATWSDTPWLRRCGWGLALGVMLLMVLWIEYVVQ